MKKIISLITTIFLVTSCTKETITKIEPPHEIVNPQSNSQNQVEGTINGGGGKGVLCRNNKTVTVETLDLYEGKVLYGLELNHTAAGQDQAIELFADLMTKHFWNPSTIALDEFKAHFKEQIINMFLKNIRFISPDKKLKLISDSFEPLVQQGCEIVQVAIYYDDSILLVDQSLWNQMNWVNRIGLLAHEFIYLLDRQNGSKNSISTRKLVGQLFSVKGARPKADGIPSDESKFTTCVISSPEDVRVGYLYAYNSTQTNSFDQTWNGLEFVFNFFKNETYLYRTSVFFRNIDLENIFKENYADSSSSGLYIDSYYPSQSIHLKFTGNGKADLYLKNGSGSVSEKMKLSCSPMIAK